MEITDNLKRIVYFLCNEIGPRGYLDIQSLNRTADFIERELKEYGYEVLSQSYVFNGKTYKNMYSEIKGQKSPEKVLIIGAHYDTIVGTPGADDNASGVAGLLELARLLHGRSFDRTIRFVAFTLEEPPLFRTKNMGSYVYAKSLKDKGEDLVGMICLESIGYFTDAPKSQYFPMGFFRWFYPDKGNFIAFVSNIDSRDFLSKAKEAFKEGSDLPVESLSSLSIVPGIDFSDHRSFWKFDYKAFMVTDSAFYRNPHYHRISDNPDTLDYKRMSKVVTGLKSAIERLATE